MTDQTVIKLPVSGAGLGDIEIHSNGTNLTVRYEYRKEGKDLIGAIAFSFVCTFRYTGEMFGPLSRECNYDELSIVETSDWLAEVRHMAASDWILDAKHYYLCLSNNGHLEVIAGAVVEGQITEGSLAANAEKEWA